VKILHENALFLHKFFINFLGTRERAQPHPQTPPLPFRPLFRTSGSATEGQNSNVETGSEVPQKVIVSAYNIIFFAMAKLRIFS